MQPITKVCVAGPGWQQQRFDAQMVTTRMTTAPITVTVISTAGMVYKKNENTPFEILKRNKPLNLLKKTCQERRWQYTPLPSFYHVTI